MQTTLEGQNTDIVQSAYAAFGRGDVQGILDTLADGIDWHPVIGCTSVVPHAGRRRGKAAIGEFFKLVDEGTEFTVFDPREFIAQGEKVVTLGHYEGKAKKTGKAFVSDFVMVFTLRNGKVVEFQEFLDAPAVNAAFEGAK